MQTMIVRITASRDNDLMHGETIHVSLAGGALISFAADDIDSFVEALSKAKVAALAASVDDEPQDFSLEL